MPENKKDTNIESFKKTLNDYKVGRLGELGTEISREKTRASVLIATIKAKRDALAAIAEEEKQKPETEQSVAAAPEQVAEMTETKKSEAPEAAKESETPEIKKDIKSYIINDTSVKQVFMKKDFLKVGLGKCIKKCKQLSKN